MYIVLMRQDSCGPIEQRCFETYEEADDYFRNMCNYYIFCKLCKVIKENV